MQRYHRNKGCILVVTDCHELDNRLIKRIGQIYRNRKIYQRIHSHATSHQT